MNTRRLAVTALVALLFVAVTPSALVGQVGVSGTHLEVEDQPPAEIVLDSRPVTPPARPSRGGRVSVQVNVDGSGANIVGDAANEPSLAVDPTDPSRIVVGWRQFDSISSNFRQAGIGRSVDGGATWTAGVLTPGVFRSDPVLAAATDGTLYYYSLKGNLLCDVFVSGDGGATWGPPMAALGGDKAWIAVDTTGGTGDGHFYAAWSANGGCCGSDVATRSLDGGMSFDTAVPISQQPRWGSTAIAADGSVYVAGFSGPLGDQVVVSKSATAPDPGETLSFQAATVVDVGGAISGFGGPNPVGLLGQVWVDTAPTGDDVYILATIDPPGPDPADVHFVASGDGGVTWSAPVRVNDDATDNGAWQWFGTMDVAPDGRIDVVWNDTRNLAGVVSELHYAFSTNGGATWSVNEVLSPSFDPTLGWPQQQKLGDYYHLISRLDAAHLAYAATFNGEQDVYYLRLEREPPVFADGFESGSTAAWSTSVP